MPGATRATVIKSLPAVTSGTPTNIIYQQALSGIDPYLLA